MARRLIRRWFRGSRCRPLGLMLLAILASCTPWTTLPPPAPGALPPETHVQVWSGGRAVVLTEVSVSADSIRGRRLYPHRTLAWVSIPRAEVDSLQVEPKDRGNWFGAGVGLGVIAGVAAMFALCRGAMGT